MSDLTFIILTSLSVGVIGLAGGYLIGRFTGTGRKAGEFEKQLEDTQTELSDYREQVYQQFGETAKKFEQLQSSYTELHAQLANSAEILCAGNAAGPLLRAPVTAALEALEPEIDAATAEPETGTVAEDRQAESEEPVTETEPVETVADDTEEVLAESEAAAITPAEVREAANDEVEAMESEAIDELLESQNEETSESDSDANFDKKDAA